MEISGTCEPTMGIDDEAINKNSFFCLLAVTRAGVAEIQVTDPWIREAPPSARMLAAYMTISNDSWAGRGAGIRHKQ